MSDYTATSITPDRMRERFDAARKQMRDAFIALGEGRITYDEAQERYFDGNEELNRIWAAQLLVTEVEIERLNEELQRAQADPAYDYGFANGVRAAEARRE